MILYMLEQVNFTYLTSWGMGAPLANDIDVQCNHETMTCTTAGRSWALDAHVGRCVTWLTGHCDTSRRGGLGMIKTALTAGLKRPGNLVCEAHGMI
jgi:hypothetical protein